MLRLVLALGLTMCACTSLSAGTVTLPSDVSVTLTAEPAANLQSWQQVTFTISVTNNGPEPVDRLILKSSPIYDELDVFNSSADCGYNLALSVIDLIDGSFYFEYGWYAAGTGTDSPPPLAAGETRTCNLSLDFTEWAPSVFPVTFEFTNWLFDLDASNNSATVNLQRAVAATPSALPTLSPPWLGLLGCLLTATVAKSRTPSTCAQRRLSDF